MIKRLGVFVFVISIFTGCVPHRGKHGLIIQNKKTENSEMHLLIGRRFGSNIDKKEDEFRMRLQDTGVTVSRVDDMIILNMPSHITFALNSLNLSTNILPVLKEISVVLNKFHNTLIEVGGHTDSIGTFEYNKINSQRHADVIMNYLIERGVMPQIISSIGFAYKYPIDTNDTQEGRQNNRRIEIRISPNSIRR